jgi:glycosyltransferase involved in cell wall biosynthesis
MIAPPWLAIPPAMYGGIERVVYDLVESLVDRGNCVTLFAPAGSETRAAFVPISSVEMGLDMPEEDKPRMAEAAGRRAYDAAVKLGVDMIHDHADHVYSGDLPGPVIRAIHGPVTDESVERYQQMSRRADQFIAISRRQRDLFEQAAEERFGPGRQINFVGVIHNPIDVVNTPFYPASAKEDYVLFVGRCHWEKGRCEAIEVAQKAGIPMKMAMRVSDQERPFFESDVEPLLRAGNGLVEFEGEEGGNALSDHYGRARALVFSSVWEEPFGLTMVEALAHGTPVIALRRGSAPEVVTDGVTGILCDDFEEMASRLPEAMKLDPETCRADALARFDRAKVAAQHNALYERVLAGWRHRHGEGAPSTRPRAAA